MSKIDLLQDLQIRKAKAKEKEYFLNDGGGLRVCVKPNGNKIWQFRFTFDGKRRKTTFKSYPIMSLKNARNKRDEYLDLIHQDIDPIQHKNLKKEEKRNDQKGIFLNVAEEWLLRESQRTEPSTHKNKKRVFTNDIYPFLKNKHMRDIDINDIIKIIEIKQIQAHEVASNIFNYLNNLFRYAVLRKYCERNLLADIKKSDILLPKEVEHYPKITDVDILSELIDAIYSYSGNHSIRNALKLVLHIPLRASNLCSLRWSYIDYEEQSLTIPRNKMKTKNKNFADFKIPLTDEVINILKEQEVFSGHQEYVFLGNDNRKPINNETPNRALQRLGFNNLDRGRKIRLHGFRGTFRSMIDTLDEDNRFSFELKERALDHLEQNDTVRAYNHKADYFKQFIPLMNFWSSYILSLKKNI